MNTERGNCKEVKCMKMLKFSARQLSNSQSKYAQLYKHKQCCKVNWSLHDQPQRGEKETWRSIEHKRSSHANQVGEWDSEMLNKRETAAQRPRAAPLASFCLLQLPLMHLPSYGRRSFFRFIPARAKPFGPFQVDLSLPSLFAIYHWSCYLPVLEESPSSKREDGLEGIRGRERPSAWGKCWSPVTARITTTTTSTWSSLSMALALVSVNCSDLPLPSPPCRERMIHCQLFTF